MGGPGDIIYRGPQRPADSKTNLAKAADAKREQPFRVALDAKLLSDLAQALGAENGRGVVLTFDATHNLRAIRVEPLADGGARRADGSFRLLMPIRDKV